MDELAARFVRAGVDDELHLSSLATMPQSEQMEFFMSYLELTALQARLICLRLAERANVYIL